ncbi:[protein release factor]-glutamine N5-methyltransferase [Halospina denitrificans]|uniref:Release factor glutamine methyltransferase n=1 Tax=Halospina denitrificans TaxID=332522 RepID=A0A4R7JMR0_9GAMM|nr:peptide chain release factor N(5)-glutamine methyltransferase [Halospina denitrificans]TDT38457.1 [protein release factor]-glutamine N5-methyltransferase [Halospina denitrificans]
MREGDTIESLLADATESLEGSGTATPRLDAELLLCHQLDCTRTRFMTWPEQKVSPEDSEAYRALVVKRCEGLPIAYITGESEFWSLPLATSPDTLIPRQDTETLVEQALLLPLPDDARVLDLGTGTGAVALALGSERYGWDVTGSDASPAAIALARRNGEALGLPGVTFVESDWFSDLEPGRWDLIVSNPPYVAEGDEHLEQGDLRFEPHSALVAGADGLDAIRLIAREAPAHINPWGWLLLEHGYEQAEAVVDLLGEAGFRDLFSRRDLTGRFRVTGGRWPGGGAS